MLDQQHRGLELDERDEGSEITLRLRRQGNQHDGSVVRVGTLNVNGATHSTNYATQGELADVLSQVDILAMQDVRLTENAAWHFQRRMRREEGGSVVAVARVQETVKMRAFGGTAIVARGEWSRAVRDWGADTESSVGDRKSTSLNSRQ